MRLAFDELCLAGAGVPPVTRRLVAALEDLKTVAPPARHGPIDRQLDRLAREVERAFDDPRDVASSLTADQQGLGSGCDVTSAEFPDIHPEVPPTTAADA